MNQPTCYKYILNFTRIEMNLSPLTKNNRSNNTQFIKLATVVKAYTIILNIIERAYCVASIWATLPYHDLDLQITKNK